MVFLINFTISFGQKTKESSIPVTNKAFVYTSTIKYISPLTDNSIQCVTFLERTWADSDTKIKYHSNKDAEINSSILFNNELYIGGYFNRINGVECCNLIKIRNDSIFAIFVGKNKKDWTKNGTYDIGTINKFCIFKEHLFAATENGLWELDNDHWIRIGTGLKGYIDAGYVNINIDEERVGACYPQVIDIAVYNEKLYLVFDCSSPIGSCFFKRKLIEFTGNKFIVVKDSTNILKENINSLTLTTTNEGLYLSTDSVLAKYNGQSMELINDKIPPLKLFTWNEQAFGVVVSTGNGISNKFLYKISGNSNMEYSIDGLVEFNMQINNIGICNNELFLTCNKSWNSEKDKKGITYLYSIKDSKILRTEYMNGVFCGIVFYNNKPLSIFFNQKKCNEIEDKSSGLLVSGTLANRDAASTNKLPQTVKNTQIKQDENKTYKISIPKGFQPISINVLLSQLKQCTTHDCIAKWINKWEYSYTVQLKNAGKLNNRENRGNRIVDINESYMIPSIGLRSGTIRAWVREILTSKDVDENKIEEYLKKLDASIDRTQKVSLAALRGED